VKTISLKKVSAVAVASLGFGLLSVVPASGANIISVTTMAITAPSTANAGTTSVPIPQGTAITATLGLDQTANFTDANDGTDITYVVTNPLGTVITSSVTITATAAPATGITATANGAVVSVRSTGANGDMSTGNAKTIATLTIPATATTVAGIYKVEASVAAVNAAGGTTDTDTTGQQMDGTTSVARGQVFVSGTTVTQGTTRGQDGAAITGSVAAVTFSTPTHTNSSVYRVVSTGVGSITSVAQNAAAGFGTGTTTMAATSGATGNWASGATLTTAAATTTEGVVIGVSSSVAGAQTITVSSVDATTGVFTEVAKSVITWGAAPTLSTANTTIHKASSTNAPNSTTDLTAIVASATAGTQRANILVTVKNSSDAALNGQTVAAAISGPGLIAWNSSATGSGTARGTVSYTMGADENAEYLVVNGDGTGGVATITFSIGTTVLGTETITFYGAVAKYTASANVVASVGASNTDAVNVVATDAAGVVVPSATIYAFSSSTAVAAVEASDTTVSSAVTESNAGTAGSYVSAKAIGTAGFTVTPVAATTATSVTITFGDAATVATSTVTTTAVVSIGSVEATTVTLTTDKKTYAPGEAVKLTLTYRDSLGRLTGTNPGTTLIGASASSVSLGGASLPAAGALATKVGTKTYDVFAPLTGGPVTVTITSGTDATHLATAARSVASSVTFSVTDPTAALATQIDALNAKIVALNALIAKIMKKLGVK
jgi:hypothetical protein